MGNTELAKGLLTQNWWKVIIELYRSKDLRKKVFRAATDWAFSKVDVNHNDELAPEEVELAMLQLCNMANLVLKPLPGWITPPPHSTILAGQVLDRDDFEKFAREQLLWVWKGRGEIRPRLRMLLFKLIAIIAANLILRWLNPAWFSNCHWTGVVALTLLPQILGLVFYVMEVRRQAPEALDLVLIRPPPPPDKKEPEKPHTFLGIPIPKALRSEDEKAVAEVEEQVVEELEEAGEEAEKQVEEKAKEVQEEAKREGSPAGVAAANAHAYEDTPSVRPQQPSPLSPGWLRQQLAEHRCVLLDGIQQLQRRRMGRVSMSAAGTRGAGRRAGVLVGRLAQRDRQERLEVPLRWDGGGQLRWNGWELPPVRQRRPVRCVPAAAVVGQCLRQRCAAKSAPVRLGARLW